MSERNELAEVIKPAAAYDFWPQKAAELALAAGYRKGRTITTAEELDGLAVNSIVRSNEFVMEKLTTGWYMPSLEVSFATNPNWLPATVLYEPTA